MKKYLPLLLLLSVCAPSFGQWIPDSASAKAKTVTANSERLLDSISSLASINYIRDSLTINAWSDSLQAKVNQRFSPEFLSNYGDSLRTLRVPEPEIGRRFDSLLTQKASLLEEVTVKQQDLQARVNDRYTDWTRSVREKFNLDSAGVKVPTSNLPGTNKPPITDLPKATGVQLPDIADIPSVPSLESSDFSSLGLSTNLSSLGGYTAIPSAPQLSEWQNSLPTMPDAMGEINKHVAGIQELAANPSEAAEKTVTQVAEGSGAVKQLNEAEQMMDQAEALKAAEKLKDPETLKKEAMERAAQEAQVLAAMNEVSKYKNKYPTMGSLSDIPKNDWLPRNGLKDRPFRERFRMGLNIGLRSSSDTVLLDLYPNASYRITGRLEAGLGAIYRLRVVTSPFDFDQRNPVWGMATFLVVKTFRAVFLRFETDATSQMKGGTSESPSYRDWRWSFHTGIQTNFKLGKQWTGNVQMLYNFDSSLKDGFPEKLTARVGVQYALRKMKLTKK